MTFAGALLVYILLHAYVLLRMGSVPAIARRLSRRWRVAAIIFLAASSFLAGVLAWLGAGWIARALQIVGVTWLGVLFLMFVCLLAVDALTLFGWLWPQAAPRLRGAALLVACGLCVIALVQGLRPPVVRNYEVRLARLPATQDGTVVVLVSDLHLGPTLGERWLQARIAQIDALHPDVVVLAGDILEGDSSGESALLATLRRLQAPLGVWAVTGNHEFYFAEARGNHRALEDAGFRVLHDQWTELRPGLVLAGVDNLSGSRRREDPGRYLDRALAGRPPGAAVLVSHVPWHAELAAADGASLMLAGHTHGGQIWPLGYLVRLGFPLMGGEYRVDGMPVIVCRGTGTWGPPMRLWRPGEIVRVVLRSQESGVSSHGADVSSRPHLP